MWIPEEKFPRDKHATISVISHKAQDFPSIDEYLSDCEQRYKVEYFKKVSTTEQAWNEVMKSTNAAYHFRGKNIVLECLQFGGNREFWDGFASEQDIRNYFKVCYRYAMQIIGKLNENGIKCTILTKGILPSKLTEFSRENEYGITLVSLSESFRLEYEPNTAPYPERIAALKTLHDAGCKTWVSVEPYPTPNICEQDLNEILDTISFVDKIIFGRLHYNKLVTQYKNHKDFFNNTARQVVEYCNKHGIAYHIKTKTITE